MNLPNPKDYKPFFRVEAEITCWHSEFLIAGSLGQECGLLAVYKDKRFETFVDIEKEKQCLKKGLALFSSKQKYQQYSSSFRRYIESAYKDIIPKYEKPPQQMTKKEFIRLSDTLSRFWYFYGFTEFSYHDLAFQEMKRTGDAVLKRNLKDLEKLKFDARDILNKYFFKNGVILNVLEFLSQHYLKDDGASYLYLPELIALFSGKKPKQDIIKQRKKCYAIAVIGKEVVRFFYQDAVLIANSFLCTPNTQTLKGVVANKGRIQGRAFIAPMLNDIKKAQMLSAEMRKGDILIAQTTSPELMALCNKAGAIVADQGGMLSHAAIVSRELGIPCIVGVNNGTRVFKDGDIVEVDADRGVVKILKKDKK